MSEVSRFVTSALCSAPGLDGVRDALFTVRDYPGASGLIAFDDCGDIQSEFELMKVHSRQFVADNQRCGWRVRE